MATNFNNVRNRHNGRTQNSQADKKSRNYLAIIIIVVFILLCIGLIFNIVLYFKTKPQTIVPVPTTEIVTGNLPLDTEFSERVGNIVNSSKSSPQAIIINLISLVFTGGSFWLLLFLEKFDRQNYYNISNSFIIISNNRFFYISLIMGIVYAFCIGGLSLFKNIDIDINLLVEKSSLIQKIYAFLSIVLLIENYIRTGYSIPGTLVRTGIFLTIGITLIVVGYIIGMILFYIIVMWLVLKIFFGMIAAENRRREEQDRMDRWVNSFVDTFCRRLRIE